MKKPCVGQTWESKGTYSFNRKIVSITSASIDPITGISESMVICEDIGMGFHYTIPLNKWHIYMEHVPYATLKKVTDKILIKLRKNCE